MPNQGDDQKHQKRQLGYGLGPAVTIHTPEHLSQVLIAGFDVQGAFNPGALDLKARVFRNAALTTVWTNELSKNLLGVTNRQFDFPSDTWTWFQPLPFNGDHAWIRLQALAGGNVVADHVIQVIFSDGRSGAHGEGAGGQAQTSASPQHPDPGQVEQLEAVINQLRKILQASPPEGK